MRNIFKLVHNKLHLYYAKLMIWIFPSVLDTTPPVKHSLIQKLGSTQFKFPVLRRELSPSGGGKGEEHSRNWSYTPYQYLLLFTLATLLACNPSESTSTTVAQDPTFEKEIIYDQFISEGANVADVDKDGDLDILAGHYWFEAPGWQPHEIRQPETFDYTTGYSHSFLNFTMDINQDGWEDFVCFDFPGAGVYWYENPQGEDRHWKEYLIDSTACNESPMTVDLDGDGRLELMFGNKDRGEMMWFQPPAAAGDTLWTSRPIGLPQEEGTRQFSHGLGWGDINGDGIKDIIIREGWWEVPADLSTFPWTFHPADLGLPCSQMYAYDFDGDGDQDVLSASAHAYGVWWHEQVAGEKGEIAFERHLIDTSFSQTHGVAFLDLNGDDLPDFVTGKRFFAHQGKDPGGTEPPVIYWFELSRDEDGTPAWERHTIDDNSGIGIHVVARDINGDGKTDILNGNKKGVIVFWGKDAADLAAQ